MMENVTMGAILISILSGILAVALIYFVIYPFLANSNSSSIKGEWNSAFEEDGKPFEEVIIVKQVGSKITAQIILKEDGTRYIFEGKFKNTILTGTFEPESKEDHERGVILLKKVRGNKMIGIQSFFSRKNGDDDAPKSSEYIWTKKK